MRKIAVPKMAKRKIESAMPGAVRRAYAQGAEIQVTIVRTGRPLKRWGTIAEITIRKNIVLKNSMSEIAWNWDEEKVKAEAANAIDYMVYGGKSEFRLEFRIV